MKLIASSIILVLLILSLGVSLAKHNEVELKKHNFWVQLFSVIIELALFYYAGLFDCFKE